MRRGTTLAARGLLAALAVAAAGCGPGSSDRSATRDRLAIAYWPQGAAAGNATRRTLRCGPPGGTVSHPATACRRLARLGAEAFAPVPPNSVCTQIFGGPQEAHVRGTVAGVAVDSDFDRTNGCEIERWNHLAPWLLPAGGAAS